MNQPEEKTGVVKWFNVGKGYGFITNPQGQDVFVHYRDVPGNPGQRNLQAGEIVTYLEGRKPSGELFAMRVIEVRRV